MTPIKSFAETISFHGHSCPGLALGYRVATYAMEQLITDRSLDEELVTIVENDACGIDAIQLVTGCTFGKGNFFFKDHGKHAYTFYNRKSGKSIRIYADNFYTRDKDDQRFVELSSKSNLTAEESQEKEAIVSKRINEILTRPSSDFLTIGPPQYEIPQKARIFNSLKCDQCQERVMETRIIKKNNQSICHACDSN